MRCPRGLWEGKVGQYRMVRAGRHADEEAEEEHLGQRKGSFLERLGSSVSELSHECLAAAARKAPSYGSHPGP